MNHRSLCLVALASSILVASAVGCTAGNVSQGLPLDPGTTDSGSPDDGDKDAGTVTPKKDSGTPDKPDAAESVPTSPFFDVTINGTAAKVKNVTVDHTNLYPDDGVSYYEITATLEKSTAIAAGLDEDPSIVIRVGKDENGTDVCKEKRGPQVNFKEPVLELREVQIHYKRFTGSQTVIAYPSTKTSGSCNMLLKSAAANGHAWGEASGSVQGGSGEPALAFEAKWFQDVSWK